jgi:hypothetical protein
MRFIVARRLADPEGENTRTKIENDDMDKEGGTTGRNLIIPQTRKRKSDTAWESSIAKKRRGIVLCSLCLQLYVN